MQRTILALTVILCAPTAVMAFTAGSELGAAGAAIQQGQIAPGGTAGSGHEGLLGENVILVKGDQSGTGPGKGGHKGKKLAEGKGGQPESRAAKAKGRGPAQPQGGPAQPRR